MPFHTFHKHPRHPLTTKVPSSKKNKKSEAASVSVKVHKPPVARGALRIESGKAEVSHPHAMRSAPDVAAGLE